MVENLTYRGDIRGEEQFIKDLKNGEEREGKIVNLWAARHNKKYGDKFEIFEHKRVTKSINRGRYIDHFDFNLRIVKNKKLYKKTIEVEHLAKNGKYFRFKRDKLERCRRKKHSIFYVHNLKFQCYQI